jgi:plasmid stability protein
MASLTIRDLDVDLKRRLAERAARHGRSLAAEARQILAEAVAHEESGPAPDNLADAIRAIVEPFGGFEIELPPPSLPSEPPTFD